MKSIPQESRAGEDKPEFLQELAGGGPPRRQGQLDLSLLPGIGAGGAAHTSVRFGLEASHVSPFVYSVSSLPRGPPIVEGSDIFDFIPFLLVSSFFFLAFSPEDKGLL